MAREPSYPKDAPVGDHSGEASSGADAAADKSPDGSKRTKHLVAGAAIGIGSAAIVAALLYAKNRNKPDR